MIDTREMNVVHVVFRREFWQLPRLTHGVTAGDIARAQVVARHADFMLRWLTSHHSAEDVALWPVLAGRVPDQVAAQMTEQHQAAHDEIERIGPLLTRWRTTADSAAREALAERLDALHVLLMTHLDAEEQQLLPLAANTLSAQEWKHFQTIGRSGRTADVPLTLGLLRYDADPQFFTALMAEMPQPVRAILLRLATRSFRAHAHRVYGSGKPPRIAEKP